MAHDFNPNLPTMAGTEDFPIVQRRIDLGADTAHGVAMRVNPGAITPKAFTTFQSGGVLNSLHSVELVDTLVPTLLSELIFPGTDTGSTKTAWTDETGAAAAFGKVAKSTDDSTYLQTVSNASNTTADAVAGLGWNSTLMNAVWADALAFRGARAGKYRADTPASRPVSVTINIRCAFANTATAAALRLQFALGAFGDTAATGPRNVISGAIAPRPDGIFRTYSLVIPADPWAMASVNPANPFWNAPHYAHTWDQIVTTGGPYAFGVVPRHINGTGYLPGDIKISGMWLAVNYAAENRRFASYPRATDVNGWSKTPAYGPVQRQIVFTSNAATTALTTPAGGTAGAGDFTADDVGATIVRQSDGQVVGTINSVTNSGAAVLVANGASTNTAVAGVLGTAPSALSANTFYYAVHGSTWAGNAKSGSPFNIVQDPGKIVLTAPGSNGENRTCYNLAFTNAGSLVASAATQTTGELIPLIISTNGYNVAEAAAGDVNAESVGYVAVDPRGTNNWLSGGPNTVFEIRNGNTNGQLVTTAAATTYQAVKLAVARFSTTLDPDQPLVIEIRHGAGSQTGGGTLDATATILPSQLSTLYGVSKPTLIEVAFAAPFLSILNTQYAVFCKSTATTGRGWTLPVLESLDAAPYTNQGNTSTLAKEICGIGGQTDAFFHGASVLTQADAMVALCAQPTTPAGLTATAQVAA